MFGTYSSKFASVTALIALISGCSGGVSNDQNASQDPPSQKADAPAVETEAETAWSVTSKTDPMTDYFFRYARATLSTDRINVGVLITCSRQRVIYELTVFDKDGQPLDMRREYGKISALVRVDNDRPMQAWGNGETRNYLDIHELGTSLVRGSKVTVRLPLLGGAEDIEIDQTNPTLRPMLDQCAQMIVDDRPQRLNIPPDQPASAHMYPEPPSANDADAIDD